MKNCKNCTFCKKDLINDYIKEANLYKCDMDGNTILDPLKEGQGCAWYEESKHISQTSCFKNSKSSFFSKIKEILTWGK